MREHTGYVRFTVAILVTFFSLHPVLAQQKPSLAPTPTTIAIVEASDLSKYEKQLVLIPGAKVVHADTAQMFMFGDKMHPVHVVIPTPAIDAAHEGDVVEITGFARRFDAKAFEKEYQWFREADY